MKHLKLFFALFAMLALGVGNAWGAEVTETIKMKSFGGKTNNSYQNVTVSGTSDAGTAMVAYAYNGSTGQVRGNKTFIAGASVTSADANKNWSLYNSQEMGGAIKSITITQTATSTNKFQNEMYVSLGTSTQGGVTTITNAQKHTSLDANTITFDIEPSKGYTYFKLLSTKKFTSGSVAGVEVKVTYVTDESSVIVKLPTLPNTQEFETETFTVELSAEEGAAIYYTLDGTDPTEASTAYTAAFTINATTTVKAIAVKDGVSSSVASATYTKVNVITGKTCAEAAALCTTTTETTDKYQVVGYVTSIVTAYDASFGNISFWMADTKDGGNVLQGYRVKPTNGDDKAVKVGDKVQVTGKLKKYNSTPEFNTGVYTITEVAPVYDVTIVSEHGTVTADPMSGIEGTEVTLTVEAASGWVFDSWTVKDASDSDVTVTYNKFNIPASNVTVTANYKASEAPDSKLCLSANGVVTSNTYKVGETVDLPETITNDCVKQFVGWSADLNCETEPEYAPGAEFTLTETEHTLYAVYATAKTGDSMNAVYTETFASCNGTGGNDNNWSGSVASNTLTLTGWTLANGYVGDDCAKFGTSSKKGSAQTPAITLDGDATLTFKAGAWDSGSEGTTLNISATGATLDQSSVTMKKGEWIEFTVAVTDVTGPVQIKFEAKTASNNRFFLDDVVVSQAAIEFSDYSTTCSAALANPTFSLTEGKYTEAKSVEIEYTEGTVHYTTDGTTPTASSTQYTGAIALNDCGEYTIKAIAISSDSQSEVVSATYTIKLPLTNSQAAPYTEAEAIAVYDGDCYDNQDVYVKGTVKSASFNSTYGNYTITLTNGFQFYRFLQAAETKFTEDIIVPGDVLVACGKLSKYSTTYQLAEGCYLVERIPYEGEKTDISNTEATAYTVDQAFALIADVTSDLTKEVYVKGLVAVAPTSNPTDAGKMTYSISDNGANTGNVLKVYLGLGIDGAKFTSKDDVKQGDYVVVKGKLLDYSGTYELTDNQLVQHLKAATITIADITMEVGETKTIAATVTPADAVVTYAIKENTESAISLDGTTITANAVGTATITATIATAAEYMGKTVDFTVTVTPESTTDEVVILAELDGKWYAMKGAVPSGKSNQLDAIEVTYFNGTLYNVPDGVKASITWTRSVVDGKATFVNNGKYLKGGTTTDLTLVGTADNNCKWMWDAEKGYYTTNTSGTIRTFLYRNGYNFKNYGVSQAGKEDANGNYSELPVVTAPVYATGDLTYTRATTAGKFGTICLPFGSTNYTGAEFFEFVGSETGKVYIGSVDELVAGVPYIFLASAPQVVVTSDGTTAATPGDSNGLYGTFTNDTEVEIGNYILKDNALCLAEAICWVNAYRAYIVMEDVPTGVPQQMPGRRYIGMSVQGENGETGFENITAPAGKTVKAIVNGQLIIIRDGEMYNAQGQLIK